MVDETPQKKRWQNTALPQNETPGVPPVVADLIAAELMNSDEHMDERLAWIEGEIQELTTRSGLIKRINLLRAIRASILASRVLNNVMASSKKA